MLDSNHRNGRTIFAPLIFTFTYLPAKIAKIKGARKFRGLQYLDSRWRHIYLSSETTAQCDAPPLTWTIEIPLFTYLLTHSSHILWGGCMATFCFRIAGAIKSRAKRQIDRQGRVVLGTSREGGTASRLRSVLSAVLQTPDRRSLYQPTTVMS